MISRKARKRQNKAIARRKAIKRARNIKNNNMTIWQRAMQW